MHTPSPIDSARTPLSSPRGQTPRPARGHDNVEPITFSTNLRLLDNPIWLGPGGSTPVSPRVDVIPSERTHVSEGLKMLKPPGNSTLQKRYDHEQKMWSSLYEESTFKNRILAYHVERQRIMSLWESGDLQADEIQDAGKYLATLLAHAYGLVDEAGQWEPGIWARIQAGGPDYAVASVTANNRQQLPGILRAGGLLAVNLGGFGHLPAAAAAALGAGINATFALVQCCICCHVPFWQAQEQSGDVARRTLHGPDYQANVSASKLVNENGTPGKLVGPDLVESRLKALGRLTPEGLKRRIAQLLDAKGKLQKKILAQDKAYVKDERAGSAEHAATKKLVSAAKRVDEELVLYTKLCEDGQTSWGEATEGRIRLKIRELQWQLAIEKAYVALSEQLSQGHSKNARNVINSMASVFGIAGSGFDLARGSVQGIEMVGEPIAQVAGLATQISQPLRYAQIHPHAAADDYAHLIRAQFQVAVLTGLGNLATKVPELRTAHGGIELKKLDALVVKPMERRITYFKSLLEYDRSVYRAAILAALSDANGTMPQGSYQASVSIFAALKDAKQRRAYVTSAFGPPPPDSIPEPPSLLEQALIDDDVLSSPLFSDRPMRGGLQRLVPDRQLVFSDQKKVFNLLMLYEANERNIALLTQGNIEALLDERSTLPAQSKDLLRNALRYATGAWPAGEAAYLQEADERLAMLKGETESRTDLGSVNQAAQKFGQTYLGFIMGSGAPASVKACVAAVQALLYCGTAAGLSPGVHSQFVAAINGCGITGNSISFLGSCCAIPLAYAAYEHIALKERHRQRDATERGASMPNAGVTPWRLLLNALRGARPTSFETFAAPQIPVEDTPTLPLYESEATFLADAFEQMMAPTFSKALDYWGLDRSSFFDIRSSADRDRLVQEHLGRLARMRAFDTDKPIGQEMRIDGPIRDRARERYQTRASSAQTPRALEDEFDTIPLTPRGRSDRRDSMGSEKSDPREGDGDYMDSLLSELDQLLGVGDDPRPQVFDEDADDPREPEVRMQEMLRSPTMLALYEALELNEREEDSSRDYSDDGTHRESEDSSVEEQSVVRPLPSSRFFKLN